MHGSSLTLYPKVLRELLMPSNKHKSDIKQNIRRRCIIASYITSTIIIITLEVLRRIEQLSEHYIILFVAIGIPLLLINFCFGAYLMGSRLMMKDFPSYNWDERDKSLELKSHHLAFRFIAILLFFLLYLETQFWTHSDLNIIDNYNGLLTRFSWPSLFIMLINLLTLPAFIHLWLEPDPIPE